MNMTRPDPNRRDVLKAGGAMAIAALSPVALAGAEAGNEPVPARSSGSRRPMKKAVMWGMIQGGSSVLEKFQILKEAGFDGVEMDSPSNIPNDEVKKACEKTGILIEGVVDSVHWRQTLTHNDPKTRAAGVEGLKTALRDCKELGGTSVLLVPGVVDKSVSYDDAYKRSQEEIRKCLPLAREMGVKIAVENVWNQFLLSPLEAARYIDEFDDAAAIGWHFDVGNVINYGWPEQWIRILGKRIVKIHVKEYSRAKRDHEGLWKGFQVELLEGDDDWPAVMKAFDDVGYNTWACIEEPGGDKDRLKALSERLDRIISL